jgi:hypothetical protein
VIVSEAGTADGRAVSPEELISSAKRLFSARNRGFLFYNTGFYRLHYSQLALQSEGR